VLYTTANSLSDDILFAIFDHYRLDDEKYWNTQAKWRNLSHVCRKWRHVIHQSSMLLNIHIPFTNGTLPLDMLSHLPSLPIVIDYRGVDAAEVDKGILHAIQQRDRIRRIDLQAPSPTLDKLIVPMDEPFPSLESLSLLSTTESKDGTKLMIPRTFSAPNLRHLASHGACLPKGLSFLSFSASLITLRLTDIGAPGYFTPEDLVARLQYIPHLEELSIGFAIPLPRPSSEGDLWREPLMLTTLPSLKLFVFRGVGAYLEGLLARISAPVLERFTITLFPQPILTLPHLSKFISDTEGLRKPRHSVVNVLFNREGVSFVVGSRRFGAGTFGLQVGFKQFDWQIVAATQVCGALKPVLSVAEEVTVKFHDVPPDWRNAIDDVVWRELFEPFNGAKRLRIGCPFASELSSDLEPYRTRLIPGLLPALQNLDLYVDTGQISGKGHMSASTTCTDARPFSSGHPVNVQPLQLQPAPSTESFEKIEFEDEPPPTPVLDPPPKKRNWFKKAIVDRVWKRFAPRIRAGGQSVVRLIS
jgi:hypothetical protein